MIEYTRIEVIERILADGRDWNTSDTEGWES